MPARPRHPMPDLVRVALEGRGLMSAYLGWIMSAKGEAICRVNAGEGSLPPIISSPEPDE